MALLGRGIIGIASSKVERRLREGVAARGGGVADTGVGVAVYRAWLAAAAQEEQGLSTLFHRETLRARMARRGFRDRSFLTGPIPFLV